MENYLKSKQEGGKKSGQSAKRKQDDGSSSKGENIENDIISSKLSIDAGIDENYLKLLGDADDPSDSNG